MSSNGSDRYHATEPDFKTRTVETCYHSDSFVRRVLLELREQGETALPTLAGMLLYKIPWLISLRFVGGIGADELAAAALATTLCNVTGLSLSVGLSSAMTTLTAQSRGDLKVKWENQQRREIRFDDESETAPLLSNGTLNQRNGSAETRPLTPLIYLYRGLFIQMVFVLPIGIWWIIGVKRVLLRLGQGEELSSMTEEYLRILAPGLWSYSINWTLTAWLQAVAMADVPAYAAAVGLILHIPLNYFFIYTLGWGYLGCACATVAFQIIQPFLMLTYMFALPSGRCRVLDSIFAKAIHRDTLSFWREAILACTSAKGILEYLGLAVPGIVIISEWWASEVSIFLSGRLTPSPALALGGMTIYQSINTFCFMFPVSCSVAGAARVGSLLGSGSTDDADFASKVCVVLSGTVSGILGCVLFFTPHVFYPSLFAPEEHDLVEETSRTIPLLALYVFADGIQSAFSGVVKGCGRKAVAMPIVVLAYWCVGVPLAYYLVLVRHHGNMEDEGYFTGDVGLVFGMTVGTWTHMILMGLVVIGTIDWTIEARKAKARLESYSEKDRRPLVDEDLTKLDVLSI